MKHHSKKVLIVTNVILLLVAVVAGLMFSLNGYKDKALAQSENIICGKRMPIGDAMEETANFIDPIFQELQAMHQTVPVQIAAARVILDSLGPTSSPAFPKICNKPCMPVCIDTSAYMVLALACKIKVDHIRIVLFRASATLALPIGYKKPCLGRPCSDINLSCSIMRDANFQINSSYNIIEKQILKKTVTGNALKKLFHKIGTSLGITALKQTEKIKILLNKARQEFNNCAMSEQERKEAEEGAISPRMAERFQDIAKSGFPVTFSKEMMEECRTGTESYQCGSPCSADEQSDECIKCMAKCLYGSDLNWFCCH